MNEGNLNGVKVDFPIIFEDKNYTANNEDELIELIDREYHELKKSDNKIKVIHAFSSLGIGQDFQVNTIQFVDNRTKEILEMFEYNQACPNFYSRQELDNYVLYQAFQMINKHRPRMF